MECLGVLLTLPMSPYLEAELHRRCHLFRLWESSPARRKDFFRANAPSMRAVVGNAAVGAGAEAIDALPRLEIVASYSVGPDKVDLARCRKRGIRVTYTPDVLTDDAADLAIGLSIFTLRCLCEADRYASAGSWRAKGDYKLASRVPKDPAFFQFFSSSDAFVYSLRFSRPSLFFELLIAASLDSQYLSGLKEEREAAARVLDQAGIGIEISGPSLGRSIDKKRLIDDVRHPSKICSGMKCVRARFGFETGFGCPGFIKVQVWYFKTWTRRVFGSRRLPPLHPPAYRCHRPSPPRLPPSPPCGFDLADFFHRESAFHSPSPAPDLFLRRQRSVSVAADKPIPLPLPPSASRRSLDSIAGKVPRWIEFWSDAAASDRRRSSFSASCTSDPERFLEIRAPGRRLPAGIGTYLDMIESVQVLGFLLQIWRNHGDDESVRG